MKKIIYIFLINFLFFTNLDALIEVDITRGNLDPLPIAVSPLHVDIKSENYEGIKIKDLGSNISKIIENNFFIFNRYRFFNLFQLLLGHVVLLIQ